jgi:hypothetical protein
VPVALWTGLIGWVGSWTSTGIARLGGTALLTNFAHAPLYGMLALWASLTLPRDGAGARGWPRIDRAAELRVLLFVALVGVLDEAHQHVGALGGGGRDVSVLDLATDLVGAGATLAAIRYLGCDDATERGLFARLAAGLAACLLAAAGATWLPRLAPGLHWL